MLYEIKKDALKIASSSWTPKELELEKYLITSEDNVKSLDSSVFGDELLLIGDELKTSHKKRADIFAIDKNGNGVIIELKKEQAMMGVETQALQYLADFSKYKGKDFIKHFSKITKRYSTEEALENEILGFLGDNTNIENINKNSRIILMAKSFDQTLFSMGEWLSEKGVAFRCITYIPIEISQNRYISFSVVFDKSPTSIYSLSFNNVSNIREPKIFWHNIAAKDDKWWEYLKNSSVIPACFDNQEGDTGYRILNNYIDGDTVIAYAAGHGAIGIGKISNPKYKLIQPNTDADILKGNCLHRLSIKWEATAPNLVDGLAAAEIRNQYGIYHPVSTSVTIDKTKGKKLIEELVERWKK